MNALTLEGSLVALFNPCTGKELGEKQDAMVRQLSVKVAADMATALTEGSTECLDAQVGDFSCERTALAVYQLVSQTKIRQELAELKSKVSDKSLKDVAVSKEMAFLIQCYLLRYVRKVVVGKSGREEFQAIKGKVKELSSELNSKLCSKIVDLFQSRVSAFSMEFLRAEASAICTMEETEKKDLQFMLSPAHVKEMLALGYVKKYVAVSFYTIKLVLTRIRDLEIPVVIKKMTLVLKKERPFGILFQSRTKGGPLEPLDKNALLPETPVIVIEGSVRDALDSNGLRQKLESYGLSNVFLSDAAQCSKDLRDQKVEIEERIQQSEKLECTHDKDPFFQIDHLFCSTLKTENAGADL